MTDLAGHYAGLDLADRIDAALAAAGLSDPLDPDALAPLDEFHSNGREATMTLARLAGLAEGERVLDAGGGIGGPARALAKHFGVHVTSVDLTDEFVRVARSLTGRAGLADRVEAHRGDVTDLPFEDGAFDVAWTQHVSMNIADKAGFARELRRVVRDGGRLAMWDIVSEGGAPEFPVPWAPEPALSHLATRDEQRAHLEEAGWRVQHWEDGTGEAIAFLRERLAPVDGPPPALGLFVIVSDVRTKLGNVVAALEDGRLGLLRAVCVAA